MVSGSRRLSSVRTIQWRLVPQECSRRARGKRYTLCGAAGKKRGGEDRGAGCPESLCVPPRARCRPRTRTHETGRGARPGHWAPRAGPGHSSPYRGS